MKRHTIFWIAAVTAVFGLLAASCGGDDDAADDTSAVTETSGCTPAIAHRTMPASAAVPVTGSSAKTGAIAGYAETRTVSPPPSTPAARKSVSSPLMPGRPVTANRATVRTAPTAPARAARRSRSG